MEKKIENNGYEFKYEIGSEVYGLKRIITNELCPHCKGKGYIGKQGNECPLCKGNNTLVRETYVPLFKPAVITEAEFVVREDKHIERYHVKHDDGSDTNIVLAEALFSTLKQAQKWCNRHNVRKGFMKIEDIKVPPAFLTTYPCVEKISKRMEEVRETGKFTNIIEVDENGTLVDGYTTYVLAKGFGWKEIEVLVHSR